MCIVSFGVSAMLCHGICALNLVRDDCSISWKAVLSKSLDQGLNPPLMFLSGYSPSFYLYNNDHLGVLCSISF